MKLWIVGGFLGAGKTSLLSAQAVNFRRQGFRPLVLENEAGRASLDDVYLADQGVEVRSMLGGCACCDLCSRFLEKLDRISGEQDHDLVLFEPSGVASIQDLVHTVNMYGPQNLQVYTTLVVDSSRLPTMLKALPSLLQSQLDVAQAVVMSKADLLGSEELEARKGLVREKAPGIPLRAGNLQGEEAEQLADFLGQALQGPSSSKPHFVGDGGSEAEYRFWSFELRFASSVTDVERIHQVIQKLVDRILGNSAEILGHVKFLGSSADGGSILISGTSREDISQRGSLESALERGWLSVILQGRESGDMKYAIEAVLRESFPDLELTQMDGPQLE